MKRKWYTKALSLILSISMTMSLIPTTAFASGSSDSLEDLYAEIESLCADSAEETSESYEVTSSVTLEPVVCSEGGSESTEDAGAAAAESAEADEASSDTDTSAAESTEAAETDATTTESTETAETEEISENAGNTEEDMLQSETETAETDAFGTEDTASVDETDAEDAQIQMASAEESDFTYSGAGDDNLKITGYSGSDTELEIPATINGYSVTEIDAFAFKNNTALVSVTVPEGVQTIYAGAFQGCTNLKTVTLPDTLTSIWNHVFYLCSSLEEINLPSGLKYLGTSAFQECESLTEIVLPDSLTELETYVFYDCPNLTTVTLPAYLTSIGEGVFSECEKLENLAFPDTLQTIGTGAFNNCTAITRLILPDGMEDLGSAFSGCTNLVEIHLPNQLKTIADAAFYGCKSLTSIEFPDGMTSVGVSAFTYCTGLEKVELPDSVTSIGNNAFSECTSLTGAVLPSGLTEIEDGLFRNCSNLGEIVIPSTVTTIGLYVFDGCGNVCLLVDQDSCAEQYAIDNNLNYGYVFSTLGTLYVEIGETEDWDAYSGLRLTVTNGDSSVTTRTTGKTSYSFSGLYADETCSVTLTGAYGDVLAQMEDISLERGSETTVTLEELQPVTDVSLEVLDASGENRSSGTTAKWLLEDGTLYAEGTSLTAVPANLQLTCQISLNKSLGTEYRNPEAQQYLVSKENPVLSVDLEPFENITLSGTVTDADGKAMAGASIAVVQTLNEKYEKQFLATTDLKGGFSLEVFAEAAEVTVSANGYKSMTQSLDAQSENYDLGTISMESLTGAKVCLTADYYTASASGPVSGRWYSWKNVEFSAVNTTTGETLEAPVLQNATLTFSSGVSAGDNIKISAVSLNDEFVPVETEVTMDETLTVTAMLTLVEYGTIAVSYEESENDAVRALAYDESGTLVWETVLGSDGTGESEGIPEGSYTVILMGEEELIPSPATLTTLKNAGFAKDTDYVSNTVTVANGYVANAEFSTVPLLDASAFLYTDSEQTSFTSNSSSVTAGSYYTLRAQAAFKAEYADLATDVKWVFEFPDNSEYVSGSLSLDKKTASQVETGDHCVSVNVDDPSQMVRFCLISSGSGTVKINAYLEFMLDGASICQSVGNVSVTVDTLTFEMSESSHTTSVPVSGTAIPKSTIYIYDNDVLVGQTTANAAGYWSTVIELYKPYTWSTHTVYAESVSTGGLTVRTATKSLQYQYVDMDLTGIKVTMLHYSHVDGNTQLVMYYGTGTASSNTKYYYTFDPSYPTFTFLVEFEGENLDGITDVELDVTCSDGTERRLYPDLDEETGVWSVSEDFSSYSIPTNFAVRYDVESSLTISREELEESQAEIEEAENELDASLEKLAAIEASEEEEQQAFLEDTIEGMDLSEDETAELEQILAEFESDEDAEFTEEDLEALYDGLTEDESEVLSEFLLELDELLELTEQYNYEDILQSFSDEIGEQMEEYQEQAGVLTSTESGYTLDTGSSSMDVVYGDCSSLTEEELLADGYVAYAVTDGSYIYIKSDGSSEYSYVDLKKNIFTTMCQNTTAVGISDIQVIADTANTSVDQDALDKINDISDWLARTELIIDDHQTITDHWTSLLEDKYQSLEKKWSQVQDLCGKRIKYNLSENNGKWASKWYDLLTKKSDELFWARENARQMSEFGETLSKLGKMLGVLGIGVDVTELVEIYSLYGEVDSAVIANCQMHAADAEALKSRITWYISGKVLLLYANVVTTFTKMSSVIPGAGWVSGLFGLGLGIASYLADQNLDNDFNNNFYPQLKALEKACRECDCDVCDPKKPDPPVPPYKNEGSPMDGKLDPSGYVYEAVASNRVEGATVTAYQLVEETDLYGETSESTVFWDAEEYSQENPLTTDAQGQYAWDVPAGLWKVKVEKSGYETAYSEWLDVPPPQTDVNIGLVSYEQPTVTSCEVYTDQITLTFSKYMITDGLADTILVTVDGETVSGTLKLDDGEANPENEDEIFASQVSFIPDETIAEGAEVTVTVTDDACSYADMCLKAAYEETASAAQRPETMTVTESLTLAYGGTGTIEIQVSPASASAGKTVTVDTYDSLLFSVNEQSLTLDENGCATATVNALLPGAGEIAFSLDGTTLKTTASVTVQNKSASSECTHDLTHHDEVSATCTADGTIEYWSCSVCGKNFSDEAAENEVTDLTLTVTGHTLTYHAAVAATCTAGGTIAYYSCSVCKKNFSDAAGQNEVTTLTTSAKGHTLTYHAAVAATCTTSGTIAYYSCSACGKNFSDAAGKNEVTTLTTSAKGHTLTYHAAVAATCTKGGTIAYYSCSVCGKNFSDVAGTKQVTSVTTAATGHSYGAWTTKTAATVFAAETQVRTCSKCGAAETRSYGSVLTPTIKVNASSIKLKVKQSTSALKVSGLANGDSVVSWKSSNKKIVTVNSKGKITAKNKTGKATITITLASGKTKKITVTVQKSAVKTTKISGLSKTVTLKKGKKKTLKPVITPITSLQKVTYSSSNKKVATVSSKGVITAKKAGTAKITVKSGSKKFVVTVKVKK